MSTKPLTQQQVDYIRAHANDRPRTKVARDAGVSMSTLYRIVREAGGEMRHDLSTRHEGIEDTVRAYYPTMTATEICARFGYSKTRINTWAKRLGVRHSAETDERIKNEKIERINDIRKRVNFQAASEKRRRKRRTDELRKLSGLPQKTRFRFSTLPAKTVKTIWRMVNKRNYFQMEGKRLVLYYDNSTRRTNAEKYLTKKYGLRFVSY